MNTNHPSNEFFPSINQFKELLENYDLLETMAEIGKIGAWKVDIESNAALWTRELFSIMEMDSPRPLALEEILDFELPSYRPIHQKAMDDLMERGIPFDIEVESLTCKGNHRWLRIIGKGMYDTEGKLTHRIGITQDITERKLLEQKAIEELKKYQTLFETIRDAILVIEEESGSILDVNHGAETLYGYPKEALCSMQCTDLCTEPETFHSALRKRTAFIPLQWQKKKDGSVFPGELTLAPPESAEPIHVYRGGEGYFSPNGSGRANSVSIERKRTIFKRSAPSNQKPPSNSFQPLLSTVYVYRQPSREKGVGRSDASHTKPRNPI